jgi:hypothetical protein
MRYYSVAYFCTIIARETDGESELDTQRDLRAERASRSFSAGASESVTNVQHLYNSYEERSSVDEYTCCAIRCGPEKKTSVYVPLQCPISSTEVRRP